jgi:hypothetical protein
MRPHKKFQHFIKWFDICFIRTKTNINKKRKERLNRNRKTLPVAQAEPAQPAHPAHQGQGGLLPPPAPPSCSVECHRASRAAATPPACLEPSPWPLLTPGDAALPSASIPPLQSFLLLLPCSISSPPEDRRGARRRVHAATVVPESCHRVQKNHSSCLRRSPHSIEPKRLSRRRQLHRGVAVVEFAATTTSPTSLTPLLASL